MKKYVRFGAAALLALVLCAVSGGLLLACMEPMEDQVYDLSLTWEGEAVPEGWVYDQKGWTVFLQEGETVTELTPDGFGDFLGPVEPGQTFYFSRIMDEELDAPTLRLGRANRTFAVFLDGDLLYTDRPELTGSIGELRLPTLEWYEEEPLLVTLPRDYAGKTLTIAQSGEPFPEREGSVWPCSVTLYCGYAYESGLVANSFQTAVPAALAFAAGALLLLLFAVQAFRGKPDLGVLCGGLTALFWMAGRLALAFLPNVSLGPLPVDAAVLARNFSLTLLLVFLASRLTGWRRILLGLFAGAQGIISAAEVAAEITKQVAIPLMLVISWAGLAGLTAAWILGSFLHNLRNICLPLLAAALLASGTALAVKQPYMDHEPPQTLDDGTLATGGGMAVSMGAEAVGSGLSIRRIDADLRFDTRRGLLNGTARYQMQNSSGTEQEYLLEVDPGCTVEQITVNGESIPFRDLKNDYYISAKNISLTLPPEEELDVVITYRCSPTIPANTGILLLYFEITPAYINMGGYHLIPSFQAAEEAENCICSGRVTLPSELELIASGKTPRRIRENEDGTATWQIQSSGRSIIVFAGNYVRVEIPEAGFPVTFCYSKNHQREFEQMDILSMLNSTLAYCTKQYGPLPYAEDKPLNIIMTSAHMMGGGASRNLSYMGETFFTAANLSDPSKGGSAAEIIAHEIIHQWWGIQRFLYDTENTDWSSEALTCYTTYRLMKELHGEAYAKQFYVDIWQEKYRDLQENYYLRNPEYLQMLPEKQQATLNALIFDSCTYAKAPLQILKAERLIGGEAEMDRILQELFQNGGTEMPPFITWQDFLDACSLTEDQLIIGGEDIG